MREPLKRSEGYKFCKLIGNERCACEERGQNPCQSLVMHLRAGKGDALVAAKLYLEQRASRARMST